MGIRLHITYPNAPLRHHIVFRFLASDQDGTFTREAGQSTDSIKRFRFIVLGGDSLLMNKVSEFILGERQSGQRTRSGICELREGHVRECHVSVVTTPVSWLERLQSCWFFSNAISLKPEMEFSESLVFPGPHAFLLVVRHNTGKEHYLLNAICEVFGKAVLDYSMVLFIGESHRTEDNPCVRTCGNRQHILTEQNVDALFVKVEQMIHSKKSHFFINHFELYKKVSNHLQMEFKEKESELQMEIRDLKTEHEKEVNNLKIDFRNREKYLQKKLADSQLNEQHLREELDASRYRESQLKSDLEMSQKEMKVCTTLTVLPISGHPKTAQGLQDNLLRVSEHKNVGDGEMVSSTEHSKASGSLESGGLKP
ncbi:GTPase IMAP family member 4-like [Xyrauchen texanus]|uniref:GTPase IMAP family member 4-like n=1 Tax=Xyrauchen texanus TaxID=154827 RepID=UPI0022423E4E|nr:GTPase IMAP family member 4-like [Xyrauchen texanus]